MTDATEHRMAIRDEIAQAMFDKALIDWDNAKAAADVALNVIDQHGGYAPSPPEPLPWSDPGIIEGKGKRRFPSWGRNR